ncbi:MobV family relaxase, partial [Clostridium perfringens]|uniref:MobV family relaxase n=1 Tax=Clostridium perfringens TaxID=1502 RepID=UPI001ABAD823
KTVLSADGSKNIIVEGSTGLVGHVKALEKQIDKDNKRKTRKDAVRAIEVLFTSDKSFFKKVDAEQYFNECKAWLCDIFGDSNMLQFCQHFDEETPHAHAILTTIKDGKFNYSGYINGRQDLRALQDSFFDKVEHLGLERGQKVELTHATYVSNKEWNKNVAKARSYAEALSPSQQLEYAIKGVMFTNQVEKLNTENMEVRGELQITKEKYENLKEGIFNILKGDSKTRVANISKIEQQGKSSIEKKKNKELTPPTLEELGLE